MASSEANEESVSRLDDSDASMELAAALALEGPPIRNRQSVVTGHFSVQQQYQEKSFFYFTLNNPFRVFFIKVSESRWLQTVSLLFIIANCMGLGFMETCDFDCVDARCKTLQKVDLVIFLFFFLEMFVKMIAMGVFGKGSYLSETWNAFDFVINLLGSTEYVYSGKEVVSFSTLRTFRVLRPLRAINRIPSLKILVELLLESLPMLGNVLVFAFFIFFVFGICGIQLWGGLLRHRCFFPPSPNLTSWNPGVDKEELAKIFRSMPPFYRRPGNVEFVCSPLFGLLRCDDIALYEQESSFCDQTFHDHEVDVCRNLTLRYTACLPDGPNPSRNTISFDDIGKAWISIFMVINLESWTEVLYLVQDAYSFWVWIYFVVLIVIGSYFALNLCLVVIANHFQEAKGQMNSKLAGIEQETSSNVYGQVLDLISLPIKAIIKKCPCYKPANEAQNEQTIGNKILTWCYEEAGCLSDFYSSRLLVNVAASRECLRRTFEHNIVALFILGMIFLNTIIMGTEHHGQPESFTKAIENINIGFTCFFTLELVAKLYAYGITTYIRDGFNMLDLIVVVVNLFELIQGSGAGGLLFVLRAFRLVRMVKIIRFLPGLQQQLLIMMKTIDNVASFFLLVSLFLFIFAIMGMSLFGCRYCPQINKYMQPEFRDDVVEGHDSSDFDNDTLSMEVESPSESEKRSRPHGHVVRLIRYFICPRTNFDTLPLSVLTVLQIFTQDSWTAIFKDGITVTTPWAGLYFVALISIGNYILFNLLVAILVEGFSTHDDEPPLFDVSSGRDRTFSELESIPKMAPMASLESLSDAVPRRPESIWNQSSLKQRILLGIKRTWNPIGEICERRHLYSFYILSPTNRFRKCLLAIITHNYFENFILLVIFINCLVITVERPSIPDDSLEHYVLDTTNNTVNTIFLLEAVIKIVGLGFFIGERAYLRDSWNILDFVLVNCSTIYGLCELFVENVESARIFEMLRVLRLLRALRPIRVINRAPGLKIVVETLLLSIKPIGNIMVITGAFFLIFGIIGVQLFRGCLYKCRLAGTQFITKKTRHHSVHEASESEMHTFEALLAVRNRTECEALGSTFEWENEGLNFDNLLQALMTLFVFSTFDGWVEITRTGIDCVGINLQPIQNYNPWRLCYFISFLLIVCFFVVNMFVGVVVNNFERVHKRVLAQMETERWKQKRRPKGTKKTKKKEWYQRWCANISAETSPPTGSKNERNQNVLSYLPKGRHKRNVFVGYLSIRLRMYRFFTHKYFELVLVAITVLNVVIMAFEYYNMPFALKIAIKSVGYTFTVLLAVEVGMKLIAIGFRRAIADRWTKLDLFILLASLSEVVFDESFSKVIPINPTIFRLLRLFRIARVFRLLKTAKGVRQLLDTVSQALPKVGHLSLVFLLLFFIYASLGVELFGKFTCPYAKCYGLSRHATFENFGMALLTLFRIFTGDKWNGILKDLIHVSTDPAYCRKLVNIKDYKHTGVECRAAGYMAPIYLVSFVLASRFVLINVVIAVLMSQLQKSQSKDQQAEQMVTPQHKKRKTRAPPNSTMGSAADDEIDMCLLRNPALLARASAVQPNSHNIPRHFSLSSGIFGLQLIDEDSAVKSLSRRASAISTTRPSAPIPRILHRRRCQRARLAMKKHTTILTLTGHQFHNVSATLMPRSPSLPLPRQALNETDYADDEAESYAGTNSAESLPNFQKPSQQQICFVEKATATLMSDEYQTEL